MKNFRELKVWEKTHAYEFEYHLLLARDLEMMRNEVYESLNSETIEIKRMLTTFIAKLREGSR